MSSEDNKKPNLSSEKSTTESSVEKSKFVKPTITITVIEISPEVFAHDTT